MTPRRLLRIVTGRPAAPSAGKLLTLALFATLLLPGCALAKAAAPGGGAVFDSPLAGTWYPGSADELRGMIRTYLDRTDVKAPEGTPPPGVLIVPHAGYIYSGPVAAYAYKSVQGVRYDRVVVIGPSHTARFSGVAVTDASGVRTPLGVVEIDRAFIDDLKKRDPAVIAAPEASSREHSVDIQLPFLQETVAPGFKLVPLIMGNQDLESCRKLAETLAAALASPAGDKTLVVASSDLSHYHSYAEARKLDAAFIRQVEAMDAPGLAASLFVGECEACGGGPVMAALLVAEKLGAKNVRILRAANSGDVTGQKDDPRGVVGYMAAAIRPGVKSAEAAETRAEPTAPKLVTPPDAESGLSADEKARLLQYARKVIEARLLGTPAPERPSGGAFEADRGTFVTLKEHGELRGCIGRIVADSPLAEVVNEMALAAAFEDPRFPPLRAGELNGLELEISVLTPFRKIANPDEVRVGVHGVVIRRGGASGLLLPQVATEQGWDRETFLRYTCRKAHLPDDAWKDPQTEIYVFSADVF